MYRPQYSGKRRRRIWRPKRCSTRPSLAQKKHHPINWSDFTEGESSDRDARAIRHVTSRGASLAKNAPLMVRGSNTRAWGGAQRRMVVGDVGPRREDEHYFAPKYVPIGFAQYDSPVIDPADYIYYRISGWRVAVPRSMPGPGVRSLLLRIYRYGPQSAGYVRLGDVLVPAILEYDERMTLAEVATGFESYGKHY